MSSGMDDPVPSRAFKVLFHSHTLAKLAKPGLALLCEPQRPTAPGLQASIPAVRDPLYSGLPYAGVRAHILLSSAARQKIGTG